MTMIRKPFLTIGWRARRGAGIVCCFVPVLVLLAAARAVPAQPTAPPPPETFWPTRGWRFSSPEAQGMDSATLADAFDFIRRHQTRIHSLLVIRNGYVVLDASFYPYREGQSHDAASVTKSITSTLIGMAIGQHKLAGVTEPVLSIFPDRTIDHRDELKQRLTMESLLTMTSGLDCRFRPGEITLREMMRSKDWVQFMLDLPMSSEPGAKFEYCSGGMHLLSGILSRATGASALDYARRDLFQPLGIEDVAWPADPGGVTYGWGDLHMRPRDLGKIGYLWLNHGRWEDRQIVAADWMEAATQAHSRAEWGTAYGYGIWVYPERNPPIYEGLGRGGQRLSVVPAKNLVVVMLGGGFEPADIGGFIGQSLKSDQPLPENAAGAARLAAAIAAASRQPDAQPIPPAPPVSREVSGVAYLLEDNPLGLKSFSLIVPEGREASARLEFADGRVEQRPVGLDGVARLSDGGRFGLPVAVKGAWEGERTFVLDYDEVANINAYLCRFTFKGKSVKVELTERTGLSQSLIKGKAVR